MLNPHGVQIRLPKWAFPKLRALGLLYKDPERGMRRISERIYHYLDPDYDFLLGLKKLLGPDVSGPEWVQCRCRECEREREHVDMTPAPSPRMTAWHRKQKRK